MDVFRRCQVSGTLALFVLEARGKGFPFPCPPTLSPKKELLIAGYFIYYFTDPESLPLKKLMKAC